MLSDDRSLHPRAPLRKFLPVCVCEREEERDRDREIERESVLHDF